MSGDIQNLLLVSKHTSLCATMRFLAGTGISSRSRACYRKNFLISNACLYRKLLLDLRVCQKERATLKHATTAILLSRARFEEQATDVTVALPVSARSTKFFITAADLSRSGSLPKPYPNKMLGRSPKFLVLNVFLK